LIGESFVPDPKLTQIKEQRKKELKKLDNQQVENTEGYVYVISHHKYDPYVSVGKAWSYESRVGTYNRGDPNREYKLEYAQRFDNCLEAEDIIHRMLEYCRHELGGDWFDISVEDAIKEIGKIEQELEKLAPCSP
jgi:hypothetical protein